LKISNFIFKIVKVFQAERKVHCWRTYLAKLQPVISELYVWI